MKKKHNMGVVLGLCVVAMAAPAAELVVSWESNGVLRSSGMVPGSTCTVEWASSLEDPFTNANEAIVFNELVADSNGMVRLKVPMFFRLRGYAIPDGMVYVPGGIFSMGDNFEGDTDERPVHSVYVSAFYMDKTEVTKAQWDEVYTWAVANGYSFNNTGSSKGSNHPVYAVNWHDVIKWCNARSQKEGLSPVYAVSGSVYKTGLADPDCNWNANGYRLPTEAEWEKAARGGLSDNRFPWGYTINHDFANYRANGSAYSYDTSPYSIYTYHPTYATGGEPYTAPVGSFAVNGYGLHDMSGNIFEWCWDWYEEAYYGVSPTSDPRGPSSGSDRVRRGGNWYSFADGCRAADRSYRAPGGAGDHLGFRAVLSAGQ